MVLYRHTWWWRRNWDFYIFVSLCVTWTYMRPNTPPPQSHFSSTHHSSKAISLFSATSFGDHFLSYHHKYQRRKMHQLLLLYDAKETLPVSPSAVGSKPQKVTICHADRAWVWHLLRGEEGRVKGEKGKRQTERQTENCLLREKCRKKKGSGPSSALKGTFAPDVQSGVRC